MSMNFKSVYTIDEKNVPPKNLKNVKNVKNVTKIKKNVCKRRKKRYLSNFLPNR